MMHYQKERTLPHHVSRSTRHAWRYPARVSLSLLILAALTYTAAGQTSPEPATWDGWQFLLGEWVGGGCGDPGQGSGGFTLLPDLQNTVLVRKNHAEYPATKDRPAFSHDDLMVIYDEHDTLKAVYFDNEKHVIQYRVAFSQESSAVVFLSEQGQSCPAVPPYVLEAGGGCPRAHLRHRPFRHAAGIHPIHQRYCTQEKMSAHVPGPPGLRSAGEMTEERNSA